MSIITFPPLHTRTHTRMTLIFRRDLFENVFRPFLFSMCSNTNIYIFLSIFDCVFIFALSNALRFGWLLFEKTGFWLCVGLFPFFCGRWFSVYIFFPPLFGAADQIGLWKIHSNNAMISPFLGVFTIYPFKINFLSNAG